MRELIESLMEEYVGVVDQAPHDGAVYRAWRSFPRHKLHGYYQNALLDNQELWSGRNLPQDMDPREAKDIRKRTWRTLETHFIYKWGCDLRLAKTDGYGGKKLLQIGFEGTWYLPGVPLL